MVKIQIIGCYVLHALASLKIRSAYRDTCAYIQHRLSGTTQWRRSNLAKMIVGYLLLGVFATCGNSRPPTQGDSQPPRPRAPASNITLDTPLIVEGDIAVTERSVGSGPALNAFRTAQESAWPNGIISYRFDEDPWDGEPVFFKAQLDNISLALQKIENGVPCIRFRWVVSKKEG